VRAGAWAGGLERVMAASESQSFVSSLKNVRINDENISPTVLHIYIFPGLGYFGHFRVKFSLERGSKNILYDSEY